MKLSIHNLSKSFGSLQVLNQFSAQMESGQIYCLMSPSGSGKTTLFRILMGLETMDSGEIQLIASDFPSESNVLPYVSTGNTGFSNLKKARISAVFQEDRLCELFTPIENVMMVTGKTMTETQVRAELARLLPAESLKRPVSTLSGGMKRRTAICRALLAEYDILIMDEPFTGLDDETRQTVIRYIKEKTAGKLVLLSTHQEQDVTSLGANLLNLP